MIWFKISLPITKRYGEFGSPCLQPLSTGKDFDRYPDIYCSSSFWLHNIALHRKLSNAIFRPVNVDSLYYWIGLNHFVQNFTTNNKKVWGDWVALSTAAFDWKEFWQVPGHLLFFIFCLHNIALHTLYTFQLPLFLKFSSVISLLLGGRWYWYLCSSYNSGNTFSHFNSLVGPALFFFRISKKIFEDFPFKFFIKFSIGFMSWSPTSKICVFNFLKRFRYHPQIEKCDIPSHES